MHLKTGELFKLQELGKVTWSLPMSWGSYHQPPRTAPLALRFFRGWDFPAGKRVREEGMKHKPWEFLLAHSALLDD